MERVLIVAKTRMNNGVCVGGLALTTNRNIRLLPQEHLNQPIDTPYDIGQIWEMAFYPSPNITPPHVEDVIITEKKFIRHILLSKLREGLLQHVTPWHSRPSKLFDGLLVMGTSRGYICEARGIPSCSTGYWLPNQELTVGTEQNNKYYYQMNSTLKIPYKGFAAPIPKLPVGTLVRVSLARWWSMPGSDEKRCYLQLSGWYL